MNRMRKENQARMQLHLLSDVQRDDGDINVLHSLGQLTVCLAHLVNSPERYRREETDDPGDRGEIMSSAMNQ